jgi:hypothetical protein
MYGMRSAIGAAIVGSRIEATKRIDGELSLDSARCARDGKASPIVLEAAGALAALAGRRD